MYTQSLNNSDSLNASSGDGNSGQDCTTILSTHQQPTSVHDITTSMPSTTTIDNFEVLEPSSSKVEPIRIYTINALGTSIAFLGAVILLLVLLQIRETSIINSCFARFMTDNPTSGVINTAASVNICEMDDLQASRSTCDVSVKETDL